VVLGWDMSAALAMAAALGVDARAAAELLPAIEAVMVRRLNDDATESAYQPSRGVPSL
jgi:hypothetical protein